MHSMALIPPIHHCSAGMIIFERLVHDTGIHPFRMRLYLGRAESAATLQGFTVADAAYQVHKITPEMRRDDGELIRAVLERELSQPPTLQRPNVWPAVKNRGGRKKTELTAT
jgi:hypothetical protein